MHSISKSITASFKDVATNIDTIKNLAERAFFINEKFTYELSITGNLAFYDSGTRYRFSDINHLKDALANEQLDDIYLWNIDVKIRGGESGTEKYTWQDVVGIDLGRDTSATGSTYGTRVAISDIEYSEACEFMDSIVNILKSKYYTPEIVDEDASSREEVVKSSYNILNNLSPLQARITEEFKDEKDFQNFLYPILKSHFPLLQEEDYLPKLAGKSSKPDFGIVDSGVAFEVKFNKKQNLQVIRQEILVDSREYFVTGSPYKTMVVVIYNASGQPIPANYVEDLESIDVIYGVAISPSIAPVKKATKEK